MNNDIEDKIEDHEHRIASLEINGGRTDEKIIALSNATENLKKTTLGFSLIMLLTIIYLLLGRDGYRDVTGTFIPIQHHTQHEVSK